MFDKWRDAFRTWRRGERRTVPYPARGRVYEKRHPAPEPEAGPGGVAARARPEAHIHMRVIRTDGTTEEYEV